MNEMDYETPSEFEKVDINSDHEPPSDKLLKKKLLAKESDYRLYKVIVKSGKHFKKPAKFDRIRFRRVDLEEESAEEKIDSSMVILECNLGMSKGLLTREEEFCIESMKKEEMALFEIEYLSLSKNGDRKLSKRQHFQVELLEWTTVIDLFQDKSVMKTLCQKGVKRDYFEEHDLAEVNCSIWRSSSPSQKIKWRFVNGNETTQKGVSVSRLIKEFLKRMKQREKSQFSMILSYFLENEEKKYVEMIWNELGDPQKDDKTGKEAENICYEIELVSLQKQVDVFDDGEVLYLTKISGESTAQVETHSEVDLDLKILVNGQAIYDSSVSGDDFAYERKKEISTLDASAIQLPPEIHSRFKEDEAEEQKALKSVQEGKEGETSKITMEFPKKVFRFWVNEYSVSKALVKSSRRMKQGEICQISLNGSSHLCYGRDAEMLKRHLGSLEPQQFRENQVVYLISVIYFETGKNAFNVNLEETKRMLQRKREVAVKLIGEQEFKKALRVLSFSDEWLKTGRRSEEEKKELRQTHISTLLNLSLCQMKSKEWRSVTETCQRIRGLDPQNRKALLRLAKALLEQQQYKEALEIFEKEKKVLEGQDEIGKEAKELKAAIEREKAKYEEKSKKIFEKMFG